MNRKTNARAGNRAHGSWATAGALLFMLFVYVAPAHAGFVEISGSGSYRKSNLQVDATDELKSFSGSISYYFNEASALELSYTESVNRRDIARDTPWAQISHVYQNAMGLDFVYTAGARGEQFRPYVKAGGLYILRKRWLDQRMTNGVWEEPRVREIEPALVPSAGLGFKLGLTEALSLKVGVDAWTSQSLNEEPLLIDYAGRVGLSWFF